MTTEVALFWLQQSLHTSAYVAGPLLAAALAVGLCVSIFQAVTSMQEMTISYIPKILVIAGVAFVLGPWMMQMLIDFTRNVFLFIPNVSQ